MELVLVITIVKLTDPFLFIPSLIAGYMVPRWWSLPLLSIPLTILYMSLGAMFQMYQQFLAESTISVFIASMLWAAVGVAFRRWRIRRSTPVEGAK